MVINNWIILIILIGILWLSLMLHYLLDHFLLGDVKNKINHFVLSIIFNLIIFSVFIALIGFSFVKFIPWAVIIIIAHSLLLSLEIRNSGMKFMNFGLVFVVFAIFIAVYWGVAF